MAQKWWLPALCALVILGALLSASTLSIGASTSAMLLCFVAVVLVIASIVMRVVRLASEEDPPL